MSTKIREYSIVINSYFLPILKELTDAEKEPGPMVVFKRVSV
jgi:hypothetical protein